LSTADDWAYLQGFTQLEEPYVLEITVTATKNAHIFLGEQPPMKDSTGNFQGSSNRASDGYEIVLGAGTASKSQVKAGLTLFQRQLTLIHAILTLFRAIILMPITRLRLTSRRRPTLLRTLLPQNHRSSSARPVYPGLSHARNVLRAEATWWSQWLAVGLQWVKRKPTMIHSPTGPAVAEFGGSVPPAALVRDLTPFSPQLTRF